LPAADDRVAGGRHPRERQEGRPPRPAPRRRHGWHGWDGRHGRYGRDGWYGRGLLTGTARAACGLASHWQAASGSLNQQGHPKMAKEKDVSLKVRPLDDRVVVEPLEAESKTAGGILLPDTAQQKPQRGRVLAVGPGKMRDNGERSPVAVAKGDEVIYGRYS